MSETTALSRRSVLKAMAAAFVAPRILLDLSHERDMAGLVNEFCHTGELRQYDLRTPWACGGDSVASDGRAIIRVPGLRFVARGDRGLVPDADAVFERLWRESGWQSLPREVPASAAELEMNESCPFCDRTECEDCFGCGCHSCHGHGYVARPECSVCHGRYFGIPWMDAAFGIPLNIRYARLARRIPGVRWLPAADPEHPVLFRGDGNVLAMVMPTVAAVGKIHQ